ncbi:MAG: HD-GYP domain-containing protein [Deltaproteobacteria bacterium]|nr:HD-GYP domain-containing protein [Deltaproteobacteria bacterium]
MDRKPTYEELEQRVKDSEEQAVARSRVDEELRVSEARFRNIIEKNADGIVIADKNGAVQFVNRAAEALFSRKAEELVGGLFGFPIVSGETAEIEIIRNKGGTRTVEMRVVETKWKDEIAHLTSLRDITGKKLGQEKLKRTLANLRKAMRGTIQLLVLAVEKRDPYTAGHQRRVADLARAIATEMGLSAEQIDGIRMAGVIHDVGKISIPAEILSKPTRLTDIEFSLIKTHSQVGYDMLKTVEFPWPIAPTVLQHHERMDGSGYPQGLSGKSIILEARIMGVSDVVEAMASHRPYRQALGINVALEEISKNRGVLYDAKAVDACLKLFKEKRFRFK